MAGGEALVQFIEAAQNLDRRGNSGGVDAFALADGLAFGVEEHGLETGAADVDGESDGALGGRCGAVRRCRRLFGFGGHQQEL